jgi:serine/threonine protein kinase
MGAEQLDDLQRVAEAVSDGTPIDWKGEMAARPELSDALLRLSQLEKVREAHGGGVGSLELATTKTAEPRTALPTPSEAADEPAPLFLWGPLRVMEKVGEGVSEVYRAYDPTLQTEVALKLRKHESRWTHTDVTNLLSEARRLARVHHPNVLVVHGADEHDGRMGIWTEFVRGMSLEEYLEQAGPLSAREATLIGLDLCRALAAVHAVRLVHRDVKTANVMREEGGRIVLTDFGSMGEIPSPGAGFTGGHIYGTAIAMAPEQLRGEGAGSASDIYGLGVLLYRMVSGHYPIEAESLLELLEKHRHGERIPLRDRRADLPLDFVEVVERALSPDAKSRYSSAGEMERALATTFGAGQSAGGADYVRPKPRPRRRMLLAAAGGITLLGSALIIWAIRPAIFEGSRRAESPPGMTAPPKPSAALTVTAALFRRTGSVNQLLPPTGGRVAPGDQLSMVVQGNEPMHAYVLNEDIAGSVYVLFPIPGVSPTNPLSASVRYRLPGQMGDSLVYWTVTSVGGREAIVAIASRAPLEELERVIAHIPRAAPGRPVRYGQVSPSALGGLRGIGRLTKEGTVPEKAHRQLEDAIGALAERAKEKGDVWVWEAYLENPSPAP